MSALGSDFTNHTVLIYNLSGTHLGSTIIREHDKGAQQIQVNIMPEELNLNDDCKLLILSSPIPCEFQGKVKRVGGNHFIAMFQGQEKENRGSARYIVSTPAQIDNLIVDGKVHPLQTPVKVVLINISTSGVRFRAPYYSFEIGDEFQMNFIISNSRKLITAAIVNFVDNVDSTSDYGCRFIGIE